VPASGIGRRLHPRLGRHLLHGAPPWDLDHAPSSEERRSDGVDVHPAEQKVFYASQLRRSQLAVRLQAPSLHVRIAVASAAVLATL
jgi:hypothetical protein